MFSHAQKSRQEILVERGAKGGGRNADVHAPQKKLPRSFATAHRHRLLNNPPHTTLHYNMRPLTEPETKVLFEKLATYCGKGISNLIADPTGGNDRNVFRVQVQAATHSQHLCMLTPSHRAPVCTMCANPSPTSRPRSRATTCSPSACASENSPRQGNSAST
jgi:hypothetical protein